MVFSEQWSSYKEDGVEKAKFVKENLLDDDWWDKVDYIISFTNSIYDVLKKSDTKASCLHIIEDPNRIYPHQDRELTDENKMFEKNFFLMPMKGGN
ncbi:unnamed protein product [Lathyrus oleraceus]